MTSKDEINPQAEAKGRPDEVCEASVGLSAMLSAATAIGVAIVAFAVWQLLL